MPGKAAVYGILLIVLAAFIVYTVQLFVPLSIKSEMNACCRNTLLKMEIEGGLSVEEHDNLIDRLEEKGLYNISVAGTGYAKQGDSLYLRVEAYMEHPMLTGLFKRSTVEQHLVYARTAAARRVVN